jgi:hypothetical protein
MVQTPAGHLYAVKNFETSPLLSNTSISRRQLSDIEEIAISLAFKMNTNIHDYKADATTRRNFLRIFINKNERVPIL